MWAGLRSVLLNQSWVWFKASSKPVIWLLFSQVIIQITAIILPVPRIKVRRFRLIFLYSSLVHLSVKPTHSAVTLAARRSQKDNITWQQLQLCMCGNSMSAPLPAVVPAARKATAAVRRVHVLYYVFVYMVMLIRWYGSILCIINSFVYYVFITGYISTWSWWYGVCSFGVGILIYYTRNYYTKNNNMWTYCFSTCMCILSP